ncbi:MAG: DUF3137 domain-containing protein [Pedobacter sp.]|nr:MAG: DUF3137 domain-containing protein [Pedobacter sp.]
MNQGIDTTLQRSLAELEAQRKDLSSSKLKSYACIAIGLALVACGFLVSDLFLAGAISGAIVLIFGFILLSKAAAKFNDYRHEYKHRVIGVALKSIDDSLVLQYDSGLSERQFINSQLFTQRPDRYDSQDQVYGTAGKTNFSFSEVHAEYKTVTQTKNGKQEHWHTILRGIVFCADFNKNFNGITVVRPKDVGAAIGAWISRNIPVFSSGSDVVNLENPEFVKTFLTHSTDQVEARYILTPAMMDRLCELNDKAKETISVSFIDTSVYLAFPLSKDYFEPPVFKTLLEPTFLEEDLTVIRFMYNIIHELDLNTRIWGKA